MRAQRMRDATAMLPPKVEPAAKKTATELEQLHAVGMVHRKKRKTLFSANVCRLATDVCGE